MYLVYFIVTILLIMVIFMLFTKMKKKEQKEQFSNKKIDIYVINLDKDKKRMDLFKKNKNIKDLNIIRHKAIYGKNIKNTDKIYNKYLSQNFVYEKRFNRQSVIGCSLSHHTLYDKLYNNINKYEYFIILEDDAIIKPNFKKKLKIVLNELPVDWDFVYLGISKGVGTKFSKNLIIPNFSQHGNWGGFGYMLSRSGLKKLKQNSKNVRFSIDEFFKKIPNLNIFICYPTLIRHDFNAISNNLQGKNRSDEEKLYNTIILK